jgi:hypothetical protein
MSPKISKILVVLLMIAVLGCGIYVIYANRGQEDFFDTVIDAIFVVAAAMVLIIVPYLRIGQIKKLKSSGIRIEAEVIGVQEIEGEKEKDVDYRIAVKAIDPKTGKEKIYYSDPLTANPQKYLPSKLTVILDPDNVNKYYVDIDFLDKIKPEEDEGVV